MVQIVLAEPKWRKKLTDADRRALSALFWSRSTKGSDHLSIPHRLFGPADAGVGPYSKGPVLSGGQLSAHVAGGERWAGDAERHGVRLHVADGCAREEPEDQNRRGGQHHDEDRQPPPCGDGGSGCRIGIIGARTRTVGFGGRRRGVHELSLLVSVLPDEC